MYLCVDAVFNLIFYFPISCTDPAKIVKFQPKYIGAVQQSVTLNCEAEGNPPPTYTWTPCNDIQQVCDKNTLHISQVFDDANYTCRVANVHGLDSKTANVCKSHVHRSHASNSCNFIHVPTRHFDFLNGTWNMHLNLKAKGQFDMNNWLFPYIVLLQL